MQVNKSHDSSMTNRTNHEFSDISRLVTEGIQERNCHTLNSAIVFAEKGKIKGKSLICPWSFYRINCHFFFSFPQVTDYQEAVKKNSGLLNNIFMKLPITKLEN